MHERVERLVGGLVGVDHALDRELEERLVESSTLAFRVAYSVLRHRQDAEDVAQEAFAKAYRNFHQLRDRDRFRAWLVRMTWRMALDRQRGNRRRTAHESADERALDLSAAELATARARADQHERAEQPWAGIHAPPEHPRL